MEKKAVARWAAPVGEAARCGPTASGPVDRRPGCASHRLRDVYGCKGSAFFRIGEILCANYHHFNVSKARSAVLRAAFSALVTGPFRRVVAPRFARARRI